MDPVIRVHVGYLSHLIVQFLVITKPLHFLRVGILDGDQVTA